MKKYLFIFSSLFLLVSCSKYLEEKPDKKLAIPSTADDLQLLLDDPFTMSYLFPNASSVLSDEYYLNTSDWESITNENYRNMYIWKKDGNSDQQWDAYKPVYQSNIVLDQVGKIALAPNGMNKLAAIKGSALFFRAFYFYTLAQLFAPPYNAATASVDLGIVLRLSPDFSVRSTRATVQETYDRIIADLLEAIPLLKAGDAIKTRPTKPAAYAMLAKVYLVMGAFERAGKYADSCLQQFPALMDYNELDPGSFNPIAKNNPEVIFSAYSLNADPLAFYLAKIDSSLISSYSAGDRRKDILFNSFDGVTYAFKGDYNGAGLFGSGYTFGGMVTDEQYLIRAEAAARAGNSTGAWSDLNTLLVKRMDPAYFIPVTENDPEQLLRLIIAERKKELLFRGTRWDDLRRLKNDPVIHAEAFRSINGETISLSANATNYSLSIPVKVISLTGIEQNP